MKRKKLGCSIVAAMLATATAVSALPASAVENGALADSVQQIVAASSASVSVIAASGVQEAAYAEWGAVTGADGYNVYVDGTQIDSMLIRQYADRFRADAVGLKAGNHTIKIVPIISGKEDTSKAAEKSVTVTAHDRSGFGWVNGTSSGAYNEDGTLRSGAVVLYVTEDTKDSVSMDVTTDSKGGTTSATGIQNILTAYQKGYETKPLCIRVIGNVTDPSTLMDGDILIKGNGASKRLSCGVTIEGIGMDATLNGFGLRIANASNVEVRNLGFMNCNSGEGDDCGLQQNNDHVWVHNCDFFYGDAGSDADQAKGDGALDTKTSSYITHSYNHFWDNGKCNLQGMKSESTDNYITYHHNWYDHSDSRHPRIRTCSVHVYNNYFDGNAKYGVGVTMGASCFVENNYFRNCPNPMMSSGQGTDALGEGTFSGETGGIIKSCGNYMTGQKSYITYAQNNTEFDAYEVSKASETVPNSVKTVSGGTTYNNFDTNSSIMYSYTADAAADVPTIVMANAGRVQGGDFQWTFDNSVDDASYAVNTALKAALTSYDDSIVAIGSGFTDNTDPVTTTTTSQTLQTTTTTVTTTVSSKQTASATTTKTPDVPTTGDIFCSPTGTGSGASESDPASVTDAVSKLTAGHTIWLLEGTYAFSEMIVISEDNSGTANAMKGMKAYNGADVTFDFSGQGDADPSKRGIVLDGDYWHFYGFEITKAADNGMLISGNNNKIEMMVFNDNQDTGLQLSRYNTNAATVADWPSNNLILNCTSKNNCDNATMENADGFAAKLTCGEGNVFDGCMAYNNSDDGWDLFAKSETGPIGVVTIQNSIAFRNGFTEFGEGYGDCDGNGFKLGGSGVGSAHVVKNCLAFENLNCGFTDNNNPKLGTLINCTAVNNNAGANGKPNFSCYRCTDDGCDFENILSYYDSSVFLSDSNLLGGTSNDKFVGTFTNGIYYNSGYYQVDAKTDIANGDKIGTKTSDNPAAADFISNAQAPVQGTDFHTAWRNADGSLNPGGLYETADSSSYKTMGYHLYNDSIVVPPTTTTSTTSSNQTETTTTTATGTSTNNPVIPSGAQIHNFTLNGTNSTFYTISGNLSTGKGTVNYNGLELTQCLKMESATSITFTNAADGNLTLVFVEPAATVKVDGTKYTASGDGIITVPVSAGAHTISKADTANLFYMVYADESGMVTETTTTAKPDETTTAKPDESTTAKPDETTTAKPDESTTTAKPDETTTTAKPDQTTTSVSINTNILYGDINLDGRVDITDAVLLNKATAGAVKLNDSQFANADCWKNGELSSDDAQTLLKFLVHLVSSLPVTE